MALPTADADLIELPLFDEPFFVACPAGHRLARTGAIALADLEREPILYLADGHCLRDQALAICGGAANGQGGDFRAASLETLRQLVAAGLGFTLLPALAIPQDRRELPGVAVRPFDGTASRRIGLVCRTTYCHMGELKLLAEVVERHLPDTVRPLETVERQ